MVNYREHGFFRGGEINIELVIESQRRKLKEFSGKDIGVPEPPPALLRTMEIFRDKGIYKFEPFGTPDITITQQDELPGLQVKPNWWFFRQVANGRLSGDAATIKAGWYLIDACRKPNLERGENRYEDDYLGPRMQKLRKEGRIYTFRDLPQDSRLGSSPNEIHELIIPEFLKTMPSREMPQPRLMMAIELNVIGNMNPELGLGETDSFEWFEDELKGSVGPRGQSAGPLTLIGGSSKRGGLSHIDFGWPEHRHPDAGFRLVIPFPDKS